MFSVTLACMLVCSVSVVRCPSDWLCLVFLQLLVSLVPTCAIFEVSNTRPIFSWNFLFILARSRVSFAVTKTRNHLKPPETTWNHLKPAIYIFLVFNFNLILIFLYWIFNDVPVTLHLHFQWIISLGRRRNHAHPGQRKFSCPWRESNSRPSAY